MQEQSPSAAFSRASTTCWRSGSARTTVIDSLEVVWPDGRVSVRRDVHGRQPRHGVGRRGDRTRGAHRLPLASPWLTDRRSRARGVDFTHRENEFVDFDRERLMPKMVSTEGPALADVADVNGDGLERRVSRRSEGPARPAPAPAARRAFRVARRRGAFEEDSISEDVGAVFFDANGDGDAGPVRGERRQRVLRAVAGAAGPPVPQRRAGRLPEGRRRAPAGVVERARACVAADYDGDGDDRPVRRWARRAVALRRRSRRACCCATTGAVASRT